MAILISDPIEFRERTVVLVHLPDGTPQPFYRSSGYSSGMPGTWLPFDGVALEHIWFIKHRFAHQGGRKYGGWHRLGSPALWVVGKLLGELDIPHGKPLDKPEDVNLFLFGSEQAPFLKAKPYDDVEAVCNAYEVRTGKSIGRPKLVGQMPVLASA